MTIFIYRAIASYRESVEWVDQTSEVLNTIDDINLTLTQIQLSRRSYIIKNEDKFLADYNEKKDALNEKLDKLLALKKDIPGHIELVQRMDSLAARSVVLLDSSIAIFNRSKTIDRVQQSILESASQNYLDQHFLTSRDIKDEEIKHLSVRQTNSEEKLANAQIFIIGTSLFVFLVLGLTLYISTRLIKNKNTAEKLLRQSYEELEEKVEERTAELKNTNLNLVNEINTRISVERTLRESEERFRLMADSAPVLIWMADKYKQFTFFNKGWLDFTGRTLKQELGKGWTQNIHPEDSERFRDTYEKAFQRHEEFELEFRLRTASGNYRWVINRGMPRYAGGEFEGYVGSCIDIHSKKNAERYLQLQYSVSRSLTESKTVKEALDRVLESICSNLAWGIGILWMVKNEKLSLGAMWSRNNSLLNKYSDLNDVNYSFEKEAGLPGRVLKFRKSFWIQNIEKETNFARKENLMKLGWKSALGFPVIKDKEIIAVIECFNNNEVAPNYELLQVLETAGRQIGNFLERKKIEEELKNSYDELENKVKERTVELANTLNRLLMEIEEKERIQNKLKLFAHAVKGVKECIFITDLEYNTIFVNSAFETIYGYYEEELLFKKIPVLFSSSIHEKLKDEILSASLSGGWKGELRNQRKDGTEFYIHLSTTVIRNDEGKVQAIVGICQDISEEKQQSALLEKRFSLLKLLNDVMVSVNKSFNLKFSISYAINKMCEYTSWDVGHCYLTDDYKFISSKIWNANLSSRYLKFKEITENSTFLSDNGFPAKAVTEKKSYWINLKEIINDPYSKRAEQSFNSGLKTGMWVPITKNNAVICVLEFFNRNEIPRDDELLDCIANLAQEIGSLYERNEFIELIKQSESHFRAISDTANDAIITVNTEGKIIYTNKSTEEIFGYLPGELKGKQITSLIPDELIESYKQVFDELTKSGKSLLIGDSKELKGKKYNGKVFPVELSLAKWELNGQANFTAIIRDITPRKITENELIESRNSLLEAQEIAKMGNWEWDVETDSLKWSDEMYNIYEIDRSQFNSTYEGFLSLLHPEDVEYVKTHIDIAYKSKSTFDFYERIITPEGKIKILRSQGGVRIDQRGNVTKFVGTCIDVTEVRQAEERIRENEERLTLIMDSIKDYAIIMIDEKGFVKSWSNAARQINGYEKEEIIGKHISMFYPEEDNKRGELEKSLEMAQKYGRYERQGWRVRKDGSKFWASISYSPLFSESGKINGFVKIIRDMTENKRAEEALIESGNRMKETQKIAKLGNWYADLLTDEFEWSQEMYRIFEVNKDFDIKDFENLKSFVYLNDLDKTRKIIEDLHSNPKEMEFDFRIVTRNGKLKFLTNVVKVEFDDNNKPAKIYGSTQDITDIKLVEEELRRTNAKLVETQKELVHKEKLAALGRFSSGIAHEIRNPLANISALAQLLSKANIEDEKMKKHLKYILINSDIANNIIKQLLQFASHEDLILKKENLTEIIETIINSIEQRCIQNKILVFKQINTDGLSIFVDRTKLENALLNFISNSVDAMPEGGNLTVNVNSNEIEKTVIIDIIDTGSGISPENLDKIFEPFFTTKGGGTGLGLALAYQTIKLHEGILNISSENGKGTHVEIKLPIKETLNGKNSNN